MLDRNNFEKLFSEYIDGDFYDKAEEVLFKLIRKAYLAGWRDCEKQNLKIFCRFPKFRRKDKNKIFRISDLQIKKGS